MSAPRDYRDDVLEALADSEAALRVERDFWRALAFAVLERASELRRELEMVDQRTCVHRTRTQDERDAWVDQTDLRREAA